MIRKLLCRRGRVTTGFAFLITLGISMGRVSADQITIGSSVLEAGRIKIQAEVPPGYHWAVVEERGEITGDNGPYLVAGELNLAGGVAEFSIPEPGGNTFLVLKLLPGSADPEPRYEGEGYFSFSPKVRLDLISSDLRPGHVLNRTAYGPSTSSVSELDRLGLSRYLDQQLHPEKIGTDMAQSLHDVEGELFEEFQPSLEDVIIPRFTQWAYRKGTSAPPSGWTTLEFDDSEWERGESGFGYADGDDNTYFADMRQTEENPDGYLTFIVRKKFALHDIDEVKNLILRVDYDDGFVAYINGREVARSNILSTHYRAVASESREAGEFEEFDITSRKSALNEGVNVLAIQLHNVNITSSDASLIPELLVRTPLDVPPVQRIAGISALQQLVHVRGVYAPNQLQAVLAEFWENHFTTDYDKVADYFEDLRNSNGAEAMSRRQARAEASQAEFVEYDFFYQNALGHFGDLLMYSATSVPQLIYLDNVTNTKTGPNENYAREILELFAFGVDNRYNQNDIEELAKCFTGWTVRKVWPQDMKAFPESANAPFTEPNVVFNEVNKIGLATVWRFAKGTLEPTPSQNGSPTTRWATVEFDDSRWLRGRTGIGYGDNDDRTLLSDMRRNYGSVYLRKSFTMDSPEDLKDLVFAIDYDDGYVAYINGVEIARSRTMEMAGSPPAHDEFASGNHEARGEFETYPMGLFAELIHFGGEENVLAIQGHNVSLGSSDFSLLPKLVYRTAEEGSIENGDVNGSWAFRFNPDDHDLGAKILFRDTEWEMRIPAGRRNLAGLKDAQDVIRMMANHISTREFISIKLINKFVSDDITLEAYHRGEAPEDLVKLLQECLDVWERTDGHIREVMKVILDPENQNGPFWYADHYRTKVKTPIEFINSSLRALEAEVEDTRLPQFNDDMGMHLFTRDDPDGWSEYGFDWISTSALLERINFAQRITTNTEASVQWDYRGFLERNQLETAEQIVRHLNQYLFQGSLSEENIQVLLQYANTDNDGVEKPFNSSRGDYKRRVETLIGLMLSAPHWQYQ